ncbi:MAG: Flagellar biosynthesis protein FlhF [Bacteriovoracaceae bacterium]|nr:Flagellar biosynthesis protein FlhF [Bacteriovoracaceae bacterium]
MGIQIKKYRATSLQKAIEEVRSELGDDAIILQTETIKDSKSLLGRTMVEVTAALDRKDTIRFHATVGEDGAERTPSKAAPKAAAEKTPWWKVMLPGQRTIVAQGDGAQKTAVAAKVKAIAASTSIQGSTSSSESMNQLYAIKTFVEPLQKELEILKAKMASPAATAKPTGRKRLQDPLEIEVQQLRSELNSYILEKRYENLNLPSFYRQLVSFWSAKGMSGRQILSFLKELETSGMNFSDQEGMNQLSTALSGTIQEGSVFEKTGPRIVALVGATGVGKTTTLAKMGAYEKIRLKKSISFISLDDYKIGGADQMQHYSRILECPFTRFRKDMSLEEQIAVQNVDTVFIDTFGIAPKDKSKMDDLKTLLNFTSPELASRLEIHLVVPVGVAPKDIQQILESFEPLNPRFLLFTKWDETENWGGMLSAILESKKPVSLVTFGQNVPDDMSIFSKSKFISTVTSMESTENLN